MGCKLTPWKVLDGVRKASEAKTYPAGGVVRGKEASGATTYPAASVVRGKEASEVINLPRGKWWAG